jgi:hypothetical protein
MPGENDCVIQDNKKTQLLGWVSFFEARFGEKAFAFWFSCHNLQRFYPSVF